MISPFYIIIYCLFTYAYTAFRLLSFKKKVRNKIKDNQMQATIYGMVVGWAQKLFKKWLISIPVALLTLIIIPIAFPVVFPFSIVSSIKTVIKERKRKKFAKNKEPLFWLTLEKLENEAFDDKYKNHLKNLKEEDVHWEHDTAGRYVRNTYGLWDGESELHKWFVACKVKSADSMSHIFLMALHRKLNLKHINLDELIEKEKKHEKN